MWQYDEEEALKDSDAVPSCDILAEALNSAGLVSEIIDKEEELKERDSDSCCDILAEALNSAGLVSAIIDASDNPARKDVDSNNVPCGDGLELVDEVGSVDAKDDDASCYLSERSLGDASYSAGTTVEAMSVVFETTEVPDSGCQADFSGTRSVGDSAELSEEVANDVSAAREAVSVSTLWTSITREEAEEITESNVDPSQFERLHGVVPQSHPAKRHSGLYKPEKVCV